MGGWLARLSAVFGGIVGNFAGFAVEFLSRVASVFIGNLFVMVVRPGLVVLSVVFLASMIHAAMDYYVGSYIIAASVDGALVRSSQQSPHLWGWLGIDAARIAIYIYWMFSLDRVIPFAIALLPVRLFWQRFSIGL